MTRIENLNDLRAELGDDIYEDEVHDEQVTDRRYVLVEMSKYDGTYFLTAHASLDDVASYHDFQEEPDDWPIQFVLDLNTNERIAAVTETRYETTFAPKAGS